MSDILDLVINECCQDTGIDAVLEINNNIFVVCIDSQSRIIDKTTNEVNDTMEVWANPDDIKLLPLEESKRSILGKKIYTMDNVDYMLKLLKVWKDMSLEMFAYSVDYDEQLVDSMLEYVILQIKKDMPMNTEGYTSYLNVFFELDREMAVAYCKGCMDVINNRQSECKLQTPEAQKIEKLLNTEQFCDKFVNYVCKSGRDAYIFMEDTNDSVILDLSTGKHIKMDGLLQYIFSNTIEEIHISDERYGAANYFLGAYKNFVQRDEQEDTKVKVIHAAMIQRFDLDVYFSSVNYDTVMCEKVLKYMYEIFLSSKDLGLKLKLDFISNNKTIKKFFEYPDKKMAMAYISGCYNMEVW